MSPNVRGYNEVTTHMNKYGMFRDVSQNQVRLHCYYLLRCVGINDVDVQILLHLEAFAAVLAQVVVKGSMNVAVMFLLTMKSYDFNLFSSKNDATLFNEDQSNRFYRLQLQRIHGSKEHFFFILNGFMSYLHTRYIGVKVGHYLTFMFSPSKIS